MGLRSLSKYVPHQKRGLGWRLPAKVLDSRPAAQLCPVMAPTHSRLWELWAENQESREGGKRRSGLHGLPRLKWISWLAGSARPQSWNGPVALPLTSSSCTSPQGHAAPILYAVWAEAGFLPEAELLNLRKISSDLDGHPVPVSHPTGASWTTPLPFLGTRVRNEREEPAVMSRESCLIGAHCARPSTQVNP